MDRLLAWQLFVGIALLAMLQGCSSGGDFNRLPAQQGSQPSTEQSSLTDDGQLPLVLYHALNGSHHGRAYDLSTAVEGGFNAVHFWEGQSLDQVLDRAKSLNLQLVPHWPSNPDVTAHAGDPTILAWYLDEEPSFLPSTKGIAELQDSFLARRSEIQALDPNKPVFLLDGPPVSRVLEGWKTWAALGDISAHNYYAVHDSLKGNGKTPASYVARSVWLSRQIAPPRMPVWFTLQAFEAPERGWKMPSAVEYRAMAMAALVHGSTGLITFALDSFVTRDDGVVGISPDPQDDYAVDADIADYNNDGKSPVTADDALRGKARLLWQEVAAFNRFLTALGDVFSRPTLETGVNADAVGYFGSYSAPVRVLVKQVEGGLVLFAVNLAAHPVDVEFSCRLKDCVGAERIPLWPFDGSEQHGSAGPAANWVETFDAMAIRVYRLERNE